MTIIRRLLTRLFTEAHNWHGRVCAYCGWPRPKNQIDNPDMEFSSEGYVKPAGWKGISTAKLTEGVTPWFTRENGRPALYYIAPPDDLEGSTTNSRGVKLPSFIQPNPDTEFSPDALRRSSTVTVEHLPSWLQSADLIMKRGHRHYARALNRTEPRWKAIVRRIKRRLGR